MDVHPEPGAVDPDDYEDVDVDDPDNPEWTTDDFARARPAREILGERLDRGGGPRESMPLRLSAEVIGFYRGLGDDWEARLNADLEDLVRIKRRG